MPRHLILRATSALSAVLFPLVGYALYGLRGLRHIPRSPWPPPPAAAAPRVTVYVPARNEERSIERCVRSLLDQTYPRDRVRVVVMDDRSTDGTGEILGTIAAADERLTVLHGSSLPAGWMGKCWALHQAARQTARPEDDYLLFVDADTTHAPTMLASTVAYAEAQGVDLLSLAPGQELGSIAERLFLPTILAVILTSNGTLAEVNDPARRRVAKAVGQFLLFRAATYQQMGGHEAVRDQIVEDFALARRVKGMGYRLVLADGRGHVTTRMYHSAREIWEGFSKNAFDEAKQQPGGPALGLVALPILGFGPYLLTALSLRALLAARNVRSGDAWAFVQGASQCAALVSFSGVGTSILGLRRPWALGQPVAMLFLWAILANSTVRTLSGRGVTWKGRRYPGTS